MAPIEEDVDCSLLWLHPLHGAAGSRVRPLRAQQLCRAAAQSLAEAVAARGVPSSSSLGNSGLACRHAGSRLLVERPRPQADEVCIELVMAEVAVAEIAGSPDQLAVAIVPLRSAAADTPQAGGSDNRVMGWVLLCYSDELDAILATLGASGCLCNDLASVCDVKEEELLGSGSFSTVVRANGVNGCDVAVKRVSESSGRGAILSEVSFLVDVQPHPNIIRFHGLFSCPAKSGLAQLAIVLDFAAGGDLFRHCCAVGRLTEGATACVMQGLLAALAHIHASGVIHRDVKPENVLLMADGRAVLADFGVATRVSDSESKAQRMGSLGYAAPEVLEGRKYGCAVDCFGAGGVLHFALSGSPPFESRTRQALMWKTCDCRVDLEKRPWTGVSAECKDLLQQLLCRSPKERLTAAEASQHAWLSAQHDAAEALGTQEALRRNCMLLQNALKGVFRILPMGL
mmetsp:Transcript_129863/g.403924  ORF Transcript_129863/g.403924 Transcript_129863/m.403924 type:complete len:457 (+) Transcript_129863:109-1479(+)